jgi:hypothetical protein
METLSLPAPDELQRRIEDCEWELKCLKRLLRMSRNLRNAEEARKSRPPLSPAEVQHAT